ncbi:MAG: DUF2214 family protein [Hyphomonadaceae bacterium]
MLLDAFLSFGHFVFVFIFVAALAAEAWVLRLTQTRETLRLLLRIDAFYGASAVGVIVLGFLRVFYGAMPEQYYWGEIFFWGKLGAFLVIGLISAIPTMRYMRWVRASTADENFLPAESEIKGVRRLVMVELHLLPLIPLFAAFMARDMPPFG